VGLRVCRWAVGTYPEKKVISLTGIWGNRYFRRIFVACIFWNRSSKIAFVCTVGQQACWVPGNEILGVDTNIFRNMIGKKKN
jgi:hypothetical protein